jgi:ketosteroid isomerase-like protein
MYEAETVLRAAVTAMVEGDVETLKTLIADDVVNHMPGTNQISGDYKGKDQFFADFFGKLMSLTGGQIAVKPHDILGNADHAIGVYTWTATRGDRRLEWRQVNVYHVRDGQLVEIWQHPFDFQRWNEFWS